MLLRRSLPVALAAVAGLALATSTGVAPMRAAAERIPTVLPSLVPSGGAIAAAINRNGVVVGAAQLPDGSMHAAVWINDRVHDLGAPGVVSWARASSNGAIAVTGSSPTARAVNNADVIVGTLGRDSQAVVWNSPTAAPRPLSAPASSVGTSAVDLNQRGAIVGSAQYLQPTFHLVVVVWR